MRECQIVKGRVEFNVNSRNPRVAKHLSMDHHRGVRSTENRYLNDGTPNPSWNGLPASKLIY